jgi:uncharacterized protein YbgA (DUF1722 family)
MTGAMTSFSTRYLDSVGIVDGFILKSRSPSCGVRDVKIFDDLTEGAASTTDAGFFGKDVLRRYPGKAIEDEVGLSSFEIREHFLTKLFTLARFREVKRTLSEHSLVAFHQNNKMLLHGYDQSQLQIMDGLVGSPEKLDIAAVFLDYEDGLHHALSRLPRRTSLINVLFRVFEGFSDKLSMEEKELFLNAVEEYRENKAPLSTLIFLTRFYAERYKIDDLSNQSFIYLYPPELMMVRDSGEGRG